MTPSMSWEKRFRSERASRSPSADSYVPARAAYTFPDPRHPPSSPASRHAASSAARTFSVFFIRTTSYYLE